MLNILIIAIITLTITHISFCAEEKHIILDFYARYPDPNEENYFYSDYTNNYLYTKIKLGSNEQNVEMKIDLNLYEVYVVKEDIVNTKLYVPFNASSSTTFNATKRFFSLKGEFSKAILSQDKLVVYDGEKDIKFNNFYFAYVDEGYNKFAGSIGFNLLKTNIYPEESMNFVDQLKNNSIISGYSLTIIFDSKYKGQFYIGQDIEEINPTIIKDYNKQVLRSSGHGLINDGKWELDLNRVLVGEAELIYSKRIRFDLKHDFIIATDEYSEYISQDFFSTLFGTDKCVKEELSSFKYYLGIKCQKNINIKNFPDLIFDLSTDYEKFNLTMDYEDLFEEKGEYLYFKVIITSNEIPSISINEEWIFGKEFFRNNIVTFNKDRKDINIYYKQKNRKKNGSEKKDNYSTYNIILLVLIFVLAIMAGVIAYLLIKCIKQGKIIKRRSRLNILEDEYPNDDIN